MKSNLIIEAIKLIYPNIKGGFCYWETRPHPKTDEKGNIILINGEPIFSWDHPIDGLVWENTEFGKPTWNQIEENIEKVKISLKKNELIILRKVQLASTDWYASRFIKRGIPIPTEIINHDLRVAQEISDIEAATTLEELENIQICFD